ncbi:2Fe-2S iron-sulfur cluster-binding protein [Paenibacillus campi]|uniref:2Fe-2S iron-sulfur cluster-binding protein n=1 Tax=Paenibacillus campi TaxID=3106031 RepID=UPI002AFDD52D|nr:2Fe-2S iron-sulfur cluster-binding protein [Paenibacillus sp. SGZ-1014]
MSPMPKENILFLPARKTVSIARGTTVLQAVRLAGLSLPVRCDGRAACLMCKVQVEQPHNGQQDGLSEPAEVECRKLGIADERTTRLGCQARIVGPAVIHLPEDRLKQAIRRQMQQQDDDLSDW